MLRDASPRSIRRCETLGYRAIHAAGHVGGPVVMSKRLGPDQVAALGGRQATRVPDPAAEMNHAK